MSSTHRVSEKLGVPGGQSEGPGARPAVLRYIDFRLAVQRTAGAGAMLPRIEGAGRQALNSQRLRAAPTTSLSLHIRMYVVLLVAHAFAPGDFVTWQRLPARRSGDRKSVV